MGGSAGAAAAAATTPLDVVKTRMMCVAASRPTFLGAAKTVMQQGGPKAFFRGVGPRALSNGLNSAVSCHASCGSHITPAHHACGA